MTDNAALELSINNLADRATNLLDANELLSADITTLESELDGRIAAAVLVSENATLVPLANAISDSITTQTYLINILNQLLGDT
jgi:hypothetical protein